MDAWVYRLKQAYDAGYYRTEAAEDAQAGFPWQNKTCKDCPLWSNNICRVFAESRGPMAHTCVYFDEPNRESAQSMIRERQAQEMQHWQEWLNDRGTTR